MNTLGYFFLNIQSSVFLSFSTCLQHEELSTVLLETYIFCLCLKNVLILYSFLKNIFTGYRILAWYFLYSKHFGNSVSFSSDLNCF